MNFLTYYVLFGLLFVGGTVGFVVVTNGLRDLQRIYQPRASTPAASPPASPPASSTATSQT